MVAKASQDSSAPLQEPAGSITISVSTWSNNGKGPWRSRQTTISLPDWEHGEVNDTTQIILRLLDKIRNADPGLTSEGLD